jgi:hypothetical protein
MARAFTEDLGARTGNFVPSDDPDNERQYVEISAGFFAVLSVAVSTGFAAPAGAQDTIKVAVGQIDAWANGADAWHEG